MQKQSELKRLAEGYRDEGEKLFKEGHMAEAVVLYRKAIQVYEQIDEPTEHVDAQVRLGVLYALSGEQDNAIESYLQALETAVKVEYHYAQARIYNNIGNDLMEIGEFRQARDMFLRGMEFTKYEDCKKNPNYYRITLILSMNLACTHTSLKQLEEADKYIAQAWKISNQAKVDRSFAIMVYEILLRAEQGNREFYFEHIDDVLQTLEDDPTDQDFQQHTELLCELFEDMGEYDRWERLLTAFEKFAELQDQLYFYMISVKLWTQYYRATGDHVNAMHMASEYFRYAEAYQEEENKKRAREISGKLDLKIAAMKQQEASLVRHMDLLTGVGDQQKLDGDYQKLLAEVELSHGNIGIGIVDIDRFREVNEQKGYLEGDKVLKTVASILQDCMSEYGLVYRLGGDKFTLLLAECTEEGLTALAEDIRDKLPQSVCQGFSYMTPKNGQTMEKHMEYAHRSLKLAKKMGPRSIMIIDNSQKDYHAFYEQYRKNMDETAMLESSFQKAESKEQWMMNILQRRQRNQELMRENQRIIGKYLTPLLNGTEEMTEETAVTLAHEIMDMYEHGYMEHLVMLEVAKIVESFLEQSNHPEEHINMLIVLGEAYGRLNADVYFDHTYLYYRKLNMYRTMLNQISKRSLRKTLYEAFLRGGVIFAESKSVTLGQNLDNIQYELAYFEEASIKETLRLSDEEAASILDTFVIHSVAGATLLFSEPDPENEELVEAMNLIKPIYERQLGDGSDITTVDDRLYGNYHRMRWLLGECDMDECYLQHKAYFEAVQGREEEVIFEEARFRKSITFRMTLYYIPELVHMCTLLSKELEEKERSYVRSLMEAYMIYLSALPKGGKETGLTGEIYHSFGRIMRYLPDWMDAFALVFKVLVERNVDNSIHSRMVSEISIQLLNMIYRMDPALLKGIFDYWEEDEIQEHYEEIRDFVKNAGLIHDIGKIEVNDIINQQVRRLTELERENIKRHPEYGAHLVENAKSMKPYVDMIMGHHRYYNDEAGYPESYYYQEHNNPLLVNLLQIADSLDAATDSIGRSYTKAKTLEEILDELEMQKGIRYNPILVGMMKKDKEFQREMKELLTKGREDICFEVYHSYATFDETKE
ncbi:diguanylate cyclase (GGDEF) domain-containing protein [Lachnospiraceae bacterium XBB1006]|nr:diguanylate cyclase (GGDEF) domain-containing protein [Lachnospiraceae bacterium XBB1006]